MAEPGVPADVAEQLAAAFRRGGYVRWPVPVGPRAGGYGQGYEARLIASSPAELEAIRVLLAAAGFALARPFAKGRRWRQPVYGRDAVERLLRVVGHPGPEPARG